MKNDIQAKTNEEKNLASRPFKIVGLNYVSLYAHDFVGARTFYTSVFGEPGYSEENDSILGWKMGSTWLTLFPSTAGTSPETNPRNIEFAIQVSEATEVDALYDALIGAGAKVCMAPRDTKMYEPMRFGCVDDPFGVRIDVYCPIAQPAG